MKWNFNIAATIPVIPYAPVSPDELQNFIDFTIENIWIFQLLMMAYLILFGGFVLRFAIKSRKWSEKIKIQSSLRMKSF